MVVGEVENKNTTAYVLPVDIYVVVGEVEKKNSPAYVVRLNIIEF